MWCYQKPGFEAFLLAELQRQQQCSQFCDTMLMAEGVSVPAHSCILSAISPQLSTALSSKTLPPAGQSHRLEFSSMGACTLLHMVRLLYSGVMAGEGEEEKQKAISAAAKMGIHGLVEVTRQDHTSRAEERDGQQTEVGVQTEPLTFEEDEVRHARWRRGVQEDSTFLWKETQPAGAINSQTMTEELQVNAAPTEASYETIDIAALQALQQSNSHLLTHQIPYGPISVIYSQDVNQMPQTCTDPAACFQESPPEGTVPVPTPPYPSVPFSLPYACQTMQLSADSHAWLSSLQAAGKHLAPGKEFSDKQIDKFQDNIPGFINYFLNPEEETFRGGQARRKSRAGGTRMAGTRERRTREPRVRGGGRWRGRLTQTVAVQEVGVSKMQKSLVQRLGVHASRTGQGGGAVGRKSYLKTRQLLKSTRRRGRCGRGLDFGPSGKLLHHGETQGGNTRNRRTTSQHVNHTCLPVSQETPASFTSPPVSFHSVSGPSPSLPLCQSAASCTPASHLLHNTAFPPPDPPPHEDQPENFDRFLEEVMMGLDILPNRVPNVSCGSTHVSTEERGAGGCRSVITEMAVEPELTAMLDLLQSVEQHDDSTVDVEEVPSRSTSEPHHKYKARTTGCRTHHGARRRKSTVQQSVNKEWTPTHPGVRKQKQTQRYANTNRVLQRHRQLCLMPVVKLMRYPLPQSVTSKTVTKTESRPADQENQAVLWCRNNYPIRSRFKEANVKDTLPFLEPPLPQTRPQRCHRGLRRKVEHLPPNDGSWPMPAQPTEQPENILLPERREGKRSAEAGGQMGDGDSAAESEELIDVETLSLCSSEDVLQRDEKKNVVWSETVAEDESKQEQLSDSEIVDVEGDSDYSTDVERQSHCQNHMEVDKSPV